MARRGFLPGVILLLLLFGAGSIHGDDSDSPCKRMQAAGGIGTKGILCIGQLTNDRLIVITRDYLVYQLPMSSLGSSVSKLYVNDSKPVPIAKKWPKIANNANFKRTRAILYNAFFYVESNLNLFFMTTKDKLHPNQEGATFDVDTQKAYRGLSYNGTDDQVLIGSYMSDQFYAINKEGGALQLCQFQRKCTGNSKVVCNITQSSYNYYMCKKDASQVTLLNSTEGCTHLDWPVLNGFISKGQFYLFGKDYVITFPEALWHKNGQPVNFKAVPYGSFIQCGGGDVGRDGAGGSKHPPLTVGMIVAIVLLVLLLLLCCVLCCIRQATLRKKRKKRNDPRAKDQTMIQSVRSDLLSGFGMLTKVTPNHGPSVTASRRSTGLSTAAGKLSKKGPSTSRMPTRRSTGASGARGPSGVQPKRSIRGSVTKGTNGQPSKRQGPSGTAVLNQVTERSKLKGHK